MYTIILEKHINCEPPLETNSEYGSIKTLTICGTQE